MVIGYLQAISRYICEMITPNGTVKPVEVRANCHSEWSLKRWKIVKFLLEDYEIFHKVQDQVAPEKTVAGAERFQQNEEFNYSEGSIN
ncbi:hypothetical protein OUZ56_020081 [Daphnia magna]|uniref:Uncharacterized protein n=1 Tax=Daphnia magna TaxID=35525 RepID=A0ABQ9ZDG6_9CRUS|nr:hypothetical protein OUZ56_020081 [Daphnia magna]